MIWPEGEGHEVLFIGQQLQIGRDAEFEDVSNKVMNKKSALKAQKKNNNNNTYGSVEEEM